MGSLIWQTEWSASKALRGFDLAIGRAIAYESDYKRGWSFEDLQKAVDYYGRALSVASNMVLKTKEDETFDDRRKWSQRAVTADRGLTRTLASVQLLVLF